MILRYTLKEFWACFGEALRASRIEPCVRITETIRNAKWIQRQQRIRNANDQDRVCFYILWNLRNAKLTQIYQSWSLYSKNCFKTKSMSLPSGKNELCIFYWWHCRLSKRSVEQESIELYENYNTLFLLRFWAFIVCKITPVI